MKVLKLLAALMAAAVLAGCDQLANGGVLTKNRMV